ncbi:MAG: hypothetical protein SVS15_11060 [Thermodesulfobacteriota bacterium]|nr:hypothetical protein [Thermodesulfobacteriota bacterium]
MRAKKTSRRMSILNDLLEVLMSKDIFETIHYHNRNESYIKQYLYQPLQRKISKMFEEYLCLKPSTANKRARTALRWEGDKKTTVNNFLFFGTQHRPDFDLFIDDLKIAIEIKRGESGTAIREGVGQSLVYTTHYDFCVYIFIDTSKDKKIVNAFTSDKEEEFVRLLWENNNVIFRVV